MCLGVPAKVLKISGRNGVVEVLGVTREVSLELLQGIREGDWVMLHAGCAIAKVEEREAEETLMLLREMQEADRPGGSR